MVTPIRITRTTIATADGRCYTSFRQLSTCKQLQLFITARFSHMYT